MGYINVYLKTTRQDLPGFNEANQYVLKFSVSPGSTVQDLLNNFNAHRRQSKQIHQVVNQNGQVANQQILKKESIFFVK